MKIINNQLTSPMMNLLKEILGSSKTAEAIKYCLKNWSKLIKFLDYSFVTPDTNAAEHAIKPFVMARKNSCHGTLKLHHSNFVANGWS